MAETGGTPNELTHLTHGLSHALTGYGRLLERDYWAVIDRCALKPSQVVELVARRFSDFSPSFFARFSRRDPTDEGKASLQEGDELDVTIKGAGTFGVRVLNRGPASFTLGTLHGHPEAGRITFGAYRNPRGDVIFHIRSRARSGSRAHLLGFLTAGDAMQTNTWTEFVNRVAITAGEGVVGYIYAEKRKIDDEPDDPAVLCSPTFLAEAD